MNKDLWMVSARFDLFFFQFTGLLCLLLILPYLVWGEASIVPIYNFYLVIFGLPHNFLTWAHIFPKNVRSAFNQPLVLSAGLICLIICLFIPFVRKTHAENWILSIITYASLWHAYRQHHGICKIYDAIQAERFKDRTLFADRKALDLFLVLALHTVLVWAATHPRIPFLLTTESMYELVYPQMPYWFFALYVVVTCIAGVWAFKRTIYDRHKADRFIPWPQLGVVTMAVITYVVPYLFIPLEAIPVSIAIGTIFHNIQYFAFVWIAEQSRAQLLTQKAVALQSWQRIAFEGGYKRFLGIALFYSLGVCILFSLMPVTAGLVLIYFLAFSHYIIDGLIWRRKNNAWLSPMLKQIALSR